MKDFPCADWSKRKISSFLEAAFFLAQRMYTLWSDGLEINVTSRARLCVYSNRQDALQWCTQERDCSSERHVFTGFGSNVCCLAKRDDQAISAIVRYLLKLPNHDLVSGTCSLRQPRVKLNWDTLARSFYCSEISKTIIRQMKLKREDHFFITICKLITATWVQAMKT